MHACWPRKELHTAHREPSPCQVAPRFAGDDLLGHEACGSEHRQATVRELAILHGTVLGGVLRLQAEWVEVDVARVPAGLPSIGSERSSVLGIAQERKSVVTDGSARATAELHVPRLHLGVGEALKAFECGRE